MFAKRTTKFKGRQRARKKSSSSEEDATQIVKLEKRKTFDPNKQTSKKV